MVIVVGYLSDCVVHATHTLKMMDEYVENVLWRMSIVSVDGDCDSGGSVRCSCGGHVQM